MSERIERLGVVGGGIMGAGIAEVAARAGLEVRLLEASAEAAAASQARIEGSLARAVASGRLEGAAPVLERVSFGTDLDSLLGCEIVVEAIVEDRQAKISLFEDLSRRLAESPPILATNTSSVPIIEVAAATGEMAPRVLGLHFFNPVPVMKLVEVIPSLLTDPEAKERAAAFAREQLGKEVIEAADRAGFTVNALLIPYLLSAIRMFEQGLASAEDIDKGMIYGCGHPMGPLRLSDLIGLDTVMSVAETLHREHRDRVYAPPPLLQRMVSANLLGRKSGRGFFDYEP